MTRPPIPDLFPRTAEDAASLLTLAPLLAGLHRAMGTDARIADLMARWSPDREAEERDADPFDDGNPTDAEIDAAAERRQEMLDAEADEAALRDEIDAGDRDRDGNFIPWPRYP